jgi:hypothetical protein
MSEKSNRKTEPYPVEKQYGTGTPRNYSRQVQRLKGSSELLERPVLGIRTGSISQKVPVRIRIRIRFHPFSHKGVDRAEIMLAK